MLARTVARGHYYFTKRLGSEVLFLQQLSWGQQRCLRIAISEEGRLNKQRSQKEDHQHGYYAAQHTLLWLPRSLVQATCACLAPHHSQTINQKVGPQTCIQTGELYYDKNNFTSSLHRFIGKSGYL